MVRKKIVIVALVAAAICLVSIAAVAQGQVIKIATQSPLSGGPARRRAAFGPSREDGFQGRTRAL
jgi:hypothetical protein